MPTSLPQPVFTRSFGHGARDVLAVHCSLGHSGAWRGVAEHLEAEATVRAFDTLSHGKSPDWDGQGDFQDRNVEAGLTMLTHRCDLVGHSFGATVALRMALARPELVRSLTLIDPVFFAVAIADGSAAVEDMEQVQEPFQAAWESGDVAQAARLFNRIWGGGGPKWPDLPEAARAGMIRSIHAIPAARAALHDDLAGVLRDGVLDRLTLPVLMIQGGETHPVIFDVTTGLERRLPDARIKTVAGSGHMVPVTHASETAGLLRDFWGAHSQF